ncbi:MAG: dTDP-4-dehydrorhamnose 3,5-epimerase [Proteobacteria bacterium]|nr:dTDP-4-dehydrorhamnose 3,5-epimerase [Pseudomonadota bacterium]
MKLIETKLPGVRLIEPKVFGDDRGYFMESWHRDRYKECGIDQNFVQSNVSKSQKNVLRGLHFQNPNSQGKLVYVLQGEVFDVAVDVRSGSPNFGQYEAVILSAKNHRQFYVPEGFAHGFCVLSEYAVFCYMCTRFYDAGAEQSILWNDPEIAIKWPVKSPLLSAKDKTALTLDAFDSDKLPSYPS